MKLVRMQAEDGTDLIKECGACGWENAMYIFEPTTIQPQAPMCGECTIAHIVEREMEVTERVAGYIATNGEGQVYEFEYGLDVHQLAAYGPVSVFNSVEELNCAIVDELLNPVPLNIYALIPVNVE